MCVANDKEAPEDPQRISATRWTVFLLVIKSRMTDRKGDLCAWVYQGPTDLFEQIAPEITGLASNNGRSCNLI